MDKMMIKKVDFFIGIVVLVSKLYDIVRQLIKEEKGGVCAPPFLDFCYDVW